MDPNPTNFPILSYVMAKIPSVKRTFSSTTSDDFDVENPQPAAPKPQEPHFELAEKMPHLKNPKLISAMRKTVTDVSQTRSILRSLGTRPDHETVDNARFRVSEIDAQASGDSDELREDYKIFKAVISLDEMHEAYERMLSEAEKKLEKIYEAALAGEDDLIEDDQEENAVKDEEVNEEVVRILKDAESGKRIERVDLSGKGLRIFPEAFGKLNSIVVLNLSNNQIEVLPDSISGLENLEELNLSANLLESLPDSMGLLFKLKILDVSRNKLSALPDSISHCRALVEIDASFNKLTYLPTNIGFELVNLKRLSIHLNKIRSLPTSIGDMKSLTLLDVHFNELHGLPPSIGKLTNLEILNISSNFSDMTELPETISDLTNLKELDLSNNQIHALPDTFGRLVNLTKLDVDQNPLAVPPKEVVAEGVEAVKAYMVKRWADILMEEEKKSMSEVHDQGQASLLTRSTSWLSNVVSNVSGTVSGYLGGAAKPNADPYLNQQL
ncbi:hypothetical protein RD792_014879 [Penstemon davidsonii]|uniref:Uncharacterized protein n=1 Tax=Penstemon davidsonii TaxID=160366 RepID=A0ABR0CQJ1_9LAMI|nr:hypothetical protein RD792_014879 [Penstemon davidsonii]